MEWWGRLMSPIRNGGFKVAARFGYRESGVFKLHQDVRTCEYEDVHILWGMLQKNEKELTTRSPEEGNSRKGGHFWNIIDWAKRAQLLCYRGV